VALDYFRSICQPIIIKKKNKRARIYFIVFCYSSSSPSSPSNVGGTSTLVCPIELCQEEVTSRLGDNNVRFLESLKREEQI
jgi:hypothetical protein